MLLAVCGGTLVHCYNEASPYHFPLLFLFLQAKQKGKAAPLAPLALQSQLLEAECQAAASDTPGGGG